MSAFAAATSWPSATSARRKPQTEIEARGLYVTPGFINIHSHASPDALPTAVNMLTQGVTTEIINADGAAPLDVAQQMASLGAAGLAVNVGGYIGFNSAVADRRRQRRPAADAGRDRADARADHRGPVAGRVGRLGRPRLQARLLRADRGSHPGRRASRATWRTNFTNHDRLTPESNFSSKVGIEETIAIGEKAGLVPVVTHMKAQGHEQGTASDRARLDARGDHARRTTRRPTRIRIWPDRAASAR